MLNLKRLGHITLRVSSMDASLAFYCGVLGLELVEGGVKSAQTNKHQGMAFLTLGGQGHDLDLLEVGADGLGGASTLHHMAFKVDSEADLRAAYFNLVDQDIAIIKATDHNNQKSIYMHDPDKNIVEIYFEAPESLAMFRQGRKDEETPLAFTR